MSKLAGPRRFISALRPDLDEKGVEQMVTGIIKFGQNAKRIGLKIGLNPDAPKDVAKLTKKEIVREIEDLLINSLDCDDAIERAYQLTDRLRSIFKIALKEKE